MWCMNEVMQSNIFVVHMTYIAQCTNNKSAEIKLICIVPRVLALPPVNKVIFNEFDVKTRSNTKHNQ